MDYRVIEVVEVGQLRVEVAIGDITRLPQRVGAVVSFDDARLSGCSATAAAIRRVAGSVELDRQIAELAGFPDPKGRLQLGNLIPTSSGALKASKILHAVVYDGDANVIVASVLTATEAALRTAEDKGLQSVAIPVPELADANEISMLQAIGFSIHSFVKATEDWQYVVRTVLLIARTDQAARAAARVLGSRASRPTQSVDFFDARREARATVSSPTEPLPAVRAPSAPDAAPAAREPEPSPSPLPSMPIPEPVKRAHAQQKLVVFVGSGLSLGRDVRGGFPTWKQLPERLLEACRTHDALPEEAIAAKRAAFQVRMSLEQMLSELGTLQAALGRDYQRALNDIFRPRDAAPGAAHRAVIQLGVRAVLTTNYDQLLEMVPEPGGPPRQAYTWRGAARALHDLRDGRKVLLKVHGSAEDHESVVMSSLEYHRARTDASYTAVLRYLLQDNLFLFVGYGMNDPMDLDLALRANTADFQSAAQRHYVLLYNPIDADIDRLSREYNVRVIPYTDHDEVRLFLAALAST